MGVGSLSSKYKIATGAADFSKGFYESGIELNRILAFNFTGIGFGVYYRYGPYHFTTPGTNIAYKFTLNFKF
jgi:hypothetical protein